MNVVLLYIFFLVRFSRARDDLAGESAALFFLLSPTHSPSFPLRISQRDQQTRGSDGNAEKDGGERDERCTCEEQEG